MQIIFINGWNKKDSIVCQIHDLLINWNMRERKCMQSLHMVYHCERGHFNVSFNDISVSPCLTPFALDSSVLFC